MIEKFFDFLAASPSPVHVVNNVALALRAASFTLLKEGEHQWHITKGEKYFLTRNGSSLIAFVVGKDFDVASPAQPPEHCGHAHGQPVPAHQADLKEAPQGGLPSGPGGNLRGRPVAHLV